MRRALPALLLAALAAAASRAGAQQDPRDPFWKTPMRLAAPRGFLEIAAIPYTRPPARDLVVFVPVATPTLPMPMEIHPHGDLAAPLGNPLPSPVAAAWATLGFFAENGADGLFDALFITDLLSGDMQAAFGDRPAGPLQALALGLPARQSLLAVRLTQAPGEVVLGVGESASGPSLYSLWAAGFESDGTPSPGSPLFLVTGIPPGGVAFDVLARLHLSPAARLGSGLSDAALAEGRNVYLLWNDPPPADFGGLAAIAPAQAIALPANTFANGVAGFDADGDGVPDLVAGAGPPAGQAATVYFVHNADAGVAGLAAEPVQDLNLAAGLGLTNPRLLEELDLGGATGLGIWDRGVLSGTGPGAVVAVVRDPLGIHVWRVDVGTRLVRHVRAADVVGSPLPDLVVAYETSNDHPEPLVEVYPDVGDQMPVVAWSAGFPPPTATAGAPLLLRVDASDDGAVRAVDWFLDGAPSPAAGTASAPWEVVLPGASLCGPSAQVVARATDDVGLWSEVAAGVTLVPGPPVVELEGAGGTAALRLLAGGGRLDLAVRAADLCGGAAAVACAADPLPGLTAQALPAPGGGACSYRVEEGALPALIALPDLSFTAVAQATSAGGTAQATARVALDASGLVAVEQSSDRTALAAGELALLTARLRSAVSVPLPGVVVEDRLEGLEPAGEPRVRGAARVGWTRTAQGVAVAVDALPGGGATVEVDLPVRRGLAGAGSSSVRAVAAASGAPLSPTVPLAAPRPTAPGWGCGSTGGEEGWLLALALLGAARLHRLVPRRAVAAIRASSPPAARGSSRRAPSPGRSPRA